MATIFEASGVGGALSLVFVFILVFAVMYALLKKVGFLGKSDGLNAMVAFIFAMLTAMSPGSEIVIGSFLPWFFMFMFLVLMIFMFFMFIGVNNESMENVTKHSAVITIALIAIIAMFLLALTKAYGPFLMVTQGTGFWATTKRLIFSRNVLGLLFMLIIASRTISFLGENK